MEDYSWCSDLKTALDLNIWPITVGMMTHPNIQFNFRRNLTLSTIFPVNHQHSPSWYLFKSHKWTPNLLNNFVLYSTYYLLTHIEFLTLSRWTVERTNMKLKIYLSEASHGYLQCAFSCYILYNIKVVNKRL